MITRIYIDNFKCFTNFEIEFSNLSLLLGDNGVGKSSIFEMIGLLQDFIAGRISTDNAFTPDNLTRWHRSNRQTFELDLVVDDQELHYRLVIEVNPALNKSKVVEEKLSDIKGVYLANAEGKLHLNNDQLTGGTQFSINWSVSALSVVADRQDNKRIAAFKNAVSKLLILKLEPSSIAALSTEEHDRLLRGGENFASWWRVLSQEYPNYVNECQEELKKIFEGLQVARMRNDGGKTRKLTLLFAPPSYEDQKNVASENTSFENVEYSFDELSDGQRVLFVLYTLVFGLQYQNYVLLLDEPENYVALSEIQPWLTLVHESTGDMLRQVLIISHHPEQINLLAREYGIWLKRDQAGPTRKFKPEFSEGFNELSEAVARGWVD